MDNSLRYWNRLANVPETHLKGFQRGGGFKGTAIKPQWQLLRMTEVFGPVGIGWGMTEPDFTIAPTSGDVLVFCKVGIWIAEGEERSSIIWGVGGDKIETKRSGAVFADDEAFKKAYTDALGNAMKMVGVASDIHMGWFDGSKYVRKTEDPDAPEEVGETEPKSAYRARQDGTDREYHRIDKGLDLISEQGSMEDLKTFWKANYKHVSEMPVGWQTELTAKKDLIKAAFEVGLNKPLGGDQ